MKEAEIIIESQGFNDVNLLICPAGLLFMDYMRNLLI